MMFDVGIRERLNENGKACHRFYRVNGVMLSNYVREAQNKGMYVFSIRRLIPVEQIQEVKEPVEQLDSIGE